ncbi:hypothetical protein BVX99_03540 [bacterium F16]|nr:hypothetical protein BVX99_03540 [bacterium F16]
MFLTGFADEAGSAIATQVKATTELGWSNIESRATGFEGNIAKMSDKDFDTFAGIVLDSGVTINCYGSGIANWGQSIDAPFEDTLTLVNRCLPRLKRLGTSMVRIMSYAIRRDQESWIPLADQMVDERVRRMNEFVPMFLDAGIIPVHENCMNYGGMCWQNSLELVERVDGLKLVFDTGNPVFSPDASQTPVNGIYPRQDAMEFYNKVKEHIIYVHIKDGRGQAEDKQGEIFPSGHECTFPDEGICKVPEIVKDLYDSGYDGGFSMEPHMATVFHDATVESPEEAKYNTYVEYGKRFERIAKEAGYSLSSK